MNLSRIVPSSSVIDKYFIWWCVLIIVILFRRNRNFNDFNFLTVWLIDDAHNIKVDRKHQLQSMWQYFVLLILYFLYFYRNLDYNNTEINISVRYYIVNINSLLSFYYNSILNCQINFIFFLCRYVFRGVVELSIYVANSAQGHGTYVTFAARSMIWYTMFFWHRSKNGCLRIYSCFWSIFKNILLFYFLNDLRSHFFSLLFVSFFFT